MICAVAFAGAVAAQAVGVTGTGDPDVDVAAVQSAVNQPKSHRRELQWRPRSRIRWRDQTADPCATTSDALVSPTLPGKSSSHFFRSGILQQFAMSCSGMIID